MIIKYNECFEYGSTKNLHQHHVVPQVRGGTKTIPLCGDCHGKVHGKNFGMEWKRLQKEGIEKARLKGLYKGRANGSIETIEEFFKKKKTQNIMKDLDNGYTFREIMEMRKCGPGLVTKVKRLRNE